MPIVNYLFFVLYSIVTLNLGTPSLSFEHKRPQSVTEQVEYSMKPESVELPVLLRPWISGGPCNRNDTRCMNENSLELVNKFRERHGKRPYLMGTILQLRNAVTHSREMASARKIYHQELELVNLGCNSFFSGENVAQNHLALAKSGTETDPSAMCIKQFKDSPPHRRNLLSDVHKYTVMDVFVASDGYIWCTQTFTTRTEFKPAGHCARARRVKSDTTKNKNWFTSGLPSTLESVLEPSPSSAFSLADGSGISQYNIITSHTFANSNFTGRLLDGSMQFFELQCTIGECNYCYNSSKMILNCLTVDESIYIDRQISG